MLCAFLSFRLSALRQCFLSLRVTEIVSKVYYSVVCCITVSLIQVMCSETKSNIFPFSFGMTEIISKVHCSVVCCITVSLVQVMCSETKSSVSFFSHSG